MKKYFVVSDIHSFYPILNIALNKQGFDRTNPEHILVVCGDAFDRGDFSVELFKFMKELNNAHKLVYIRGNHEDLLEDLIFDIRHRKDIGRHHISNGTLNTVADIVGCSIYDILSNVFDWDIFEKRMTELLKFINETSVDYFQLGNTVFVHGWVPTTCDENKTMIVDENWRDGDWREARWENGMEMFHFDIVPPDVETVVCGHFHTSFAWHQYEDICPEWGPLAKFDTYIKYQDNSNSRIVALDACTAYSKKVNCVIFDENGKMIGDEIHDK